MSFTLKKLRDEPIVIIRLVLPFHQHMIAIQTAIAEVAEMAKTMPAPIYCVFDASSMHNLCYSDILLWMMEHTYQRPGSLTDLRVRSVLVGSGEMFELWVRKVRERTGIFVPGVSSVDEALKHIREQLAADNTVPTETPYPIR